MDPIPAISKIFSYVAQQERQLLGNSSSPNFNFESKEISINAAKSICDYCGRMGHTENVCYKKHGMPLNHETRNKSNGGRKTCTHCGKIGHTIDVCYWKHGYPPGYKPFNGRSTVNNMVTMDNKTLDDQTQQHESQDLVQFSPEQYKALLALIQRPSTGNAASEQTKQVASISSCTTDKLSNPGMSRPIMSSWILDSGATDHVTCSLNNLHSYEPINPVTVKLPNGHHVHATHSGIVHLSKTITLFDVLYIPTFTFNLISISKLVSSTDCALIFSSTSCMLQDTNNRMKIGIVEERHGLYHLIPDQNDKAICSTIVHPKCNIIPVDLWHFQMGHLSTERLQCIRSYYPILRNNKDFVCNTCHYTKHKKLPFSSSISHASHIFDLLHMDIWGPCSKTSMHGHKYFLTIADDHSRFTWIHLMHTKAETRDIIISFIASIETQYNRKVKTIRSDNGSEFLMPSFYASKGIMHQATCVETPEQNGIAERKHQHLLNVTCALLFQANLPSSSWCYALLHAAYLVNCIPTPFLHNISPYEKLHGHIPDISHLRIFGCLCYASTLKANRKKLDPRAHPCIFIRFKPNTKGYLIYDLHSHSIITSRNVVFYENHFPQIINSQHSDMKLSTPLPEPFFITQHDSIIEITPTLPPVNEPVNITHAVEPTSSQPRRSTRTKQAPTYLQDYHRELSSHDTNPSTKVRYPLSSVLSYSRLSPTHKHFVISITSTVEPSSYAEASQHDCWIKAMKAELQAL